MGDKKIKIGIIGAGNIAQNSHIPAYLKQDDAEIIAICDINLDRAREVAAKHNIKYAVGSIEELVAIDEIDAVSICTWNNAHAKAASSQRRQACPVRKAHGHDRSRSGRNEGSGGEEQYSVHDGLYQPFPLRQQGYQGDSRER